MGNACCGASRFTGASLRRCHGTYWPPLVPAAAAIGAETFTFFHEATFSDRIKNINRVRDCLRRDGLSGTPSTAWHAARIPEETESAKVAPSATAPVIVPLIGFRAGSPSVGIALSGDF